jgi:4-amino-4-deoxy-L-arabinose transferase-like glycosyltransferase
VSGPVAARTASCPRAGHLRAKRPFEYKLTPESAGTPRLFPAGLNAAIHTRCAESSLFRRVFHDVSPRMNSDPCTMPRWREPEFWLLAVLVVAMYGSRLTDLSLRGEESRRGLVAIEMLDRGDWIVPRQQGDPFFMSCRPPLQSWLIAAIGSLRGEVDAVAIRLPSALALLSIVLLAYGYSRNFLSRLGALSAGAACATFAQVMELARLGETDALFTLFVSGSLLMWHAGFVRRWSSGLTWSCGYVGAALATLTKGPQGPVYFAGPVLAYLLFTRQWRFALSRGHLLGLCVFALTLGIWQVPYFLDLGWAGIRHIYFGDVRSYVHDWRLSVVIEHLVSYPATILAGCLAPWSIMLIGYMRRDFRAGLGKARDLALFLAIALAVTFPTVWFATTSLPRFYMSMYPCVGVLVGLAVQQSAEAGARIEYHRLWKFFASAMGVAMLAMGPLVLTAALLGVETWNSGQPVWFSVVYCMTSIGLGIVSWKSRLPSNHTAARAGVVAIAAFLGLSSTGVYLNHRVATSLPSAAAVARIKQALPSEARLVSLGPVNHLFNCLYGRPIPVFPMPAAQDRLNEFEYFCVMANGWETPQLPFAWDEIGAVVCDRYWMPIPEQRIVVGRRRESPSGDAGDVSSGEPVEVIGGNDAGDSPLRR